MVLFIIVCKGALTFDSGRKPKVSKLYILLCHSSKVVLTFEFEDETSSVTIENEKAVEQYFPVVLFIGILKCDHSNES